MCAETVIMKQWISRNISAWWNVWCAWHDISVNCDSWLSLLFIAHLDWKASGYYSDLTKLCSTDFKQSCCKKYFWLNILEKCLEDKILNNP